MSHPKAARSALRHIALARATVRRCAALLVALLAPVAGAGAGDLVPPDPWEIIHAVRALGPAEVGRDAFRDPRITAHLDNDGGALRDRPYHLTFHGCDLGRNCTSVLLAIRLDRPEWEDKPPAAHVLHDWNRRKLMGRAWLDDRNRAVLDHVVVVGPGLPSATLSATLNAWAIAMVEFAEHVDFAGK